MVNMKCYFNIYKLFMKLFLFFVIFIFSLQAQATKIISIGVCSDLWALALFPKDEILSLTKGADNLTISPYTKIAGSIPKHKGTLEDVLAYNPDMIIGDDYTDPFLAKNIKRLGLSYKHINLVNKLDQWQLETIRIGEMLNKKQKAQEIVKEYSPLWKEILLNKKKLEEKNIGLVANFRPAGYTSGTLSLTDDVIKYIGGTSLAQKNNYAFNTQISLEKLLLEKPNRLLFDLRYENNGSNAQKILKHPALSSLKNLPKNFFPLRYGFCLSPESLKGVLKLQEEILNE